MPLICAANAFSAFDAAKDTFPTDFSIWANNTWGSTSFSNFRDSKSDKCDGKPGSLNGVPVAAFVAPVCGNPTYELYLQSGTLLSSSFGSSNIKIVQNNGLWELSVRSSNPSLRGTYQVYIKGTLLTQTKSSNIFTFTVYDECNPFDCTLAAFYPQPTGIKPTNITVMVGQGFVKSN